MQEPATDRDVLDPDELWDIDEELFEILKEGRGGDEPWGFTTPQRAHEKIVEEYGRDVGPQHVQQRLDFLRSHGHLEKFSRGVYKFVSDPRED